MRILRIVGFRVVALIGLFYFASGEIAAAPLDLNGKTILVDYTICPDFVQQVNGRCLRTRQRFTIVGDRVLFYADGITPEGTIFVIGQKIEITDGDDRARFVFGKDFPGIYQKAWVAASYTNQQLRLLSIHNRYRDNGEIFQESSNSFTFDFYSQDECNLASQVWSVITGSGPSTDRKVFVLREQTCQIRDTN